MTVWFDVVAAGGNQSQTLAFANITDAPALAFNVNDVPQLASLVAAGTHDLQCVQWNYTAGYTAIATSVVDSTGAFTCQPATAAHLRVVRRRVHRHVAAAAHVIVLLQRRVGSVAPVLVLVVVVVGSVSTPTMFAYLFSGYSGARSTGGYYFWMAVSIALCLLFPAFVLTFKPVSHSAAAKNRALQNEPIPAVTKPRVEVAPRSSVFVAQNEQIMPSTQQPVSPARPVVDELMERERASTIDVAGTMDYGDVNALKRNVYNNEHERKDEEEEANADEVGFVIHQ